VRRLRPSHFIRWNGNDSVVKSFSTFSFANQVEEDESSIIEQIRELLTFAVRKRLQSKKRIGVFLSGGLDSSSMVSLLHQAGRVGISTFSFRCQGKSFDESNYAKIVADTFGTIHHVVEYTPKSVLLAEHMVDLMDEPFCDVGINIATYLMARMAGGTVDNLFTGDGGDELFGGHPVYMADKTARFFQWMPRIILQPLFVLGRSLPDSDQKKDWKVKIKRFSESYRFPSQLGTHRWRAYYQLSELEDLIDPDIFNQAGLINPFEDILSYNQETDGSDPLSRSLQSDYQTVVQFYLRRMDLVRAFGMTPRFPMLDDRLVSYCGRVPSSLKIRGFSDTKYIEKKAIEPWLPESIVYRKDKLGHSIPLKNWLRDNPLVQQFVFDLLSEGTVKKRGLFQVSAIQKMKEEHLQKIRNHSHRLWALAILELWLASKEKISSTTER
jgi:asparagine synthase (glutamine-hydrolysing)